MTTGPAAGRRWWHVAAALAVLVAGAGASFSLSRYQAQVIAANAHTSFQSAAGSVSAQTDLHLSRYADLVSAIQGLHNASSHVNHDEFHEFSDGQLTGRRYPGLGAILAADTGPDGRVELSDIHLEPEVDPASLGLVPGNLHIVRTTLRRATDAGSGILSQPVPLPHVPGTPVGLLLVTPLFRDGATPATVTERRAAVTGWVGVAFRADQFLSQVLVRDVDGIGTELFDGPPKGGRLVTSRPRGFTAAADPVDERLIAVSAGGRLWTLRMQTLPRRAGAPGLPVPQVILVAGLLLTAMLATVVWTLGRSSNHAIRLVAQRTGDLRHSEQRFRSLAAESPLGVFGLAADGSCEYANDQLLALSERSAADLHGDGLAETFCPEDQAALRRAWSDGGSAAALRLRMVRPDGSLRWVKTHAAPLRSDDGAVTGWVGSIEDVTAEVEAQRASQRLAAELAYRARHDHLTGLPNRAYFMECLSEALADPTRHSPVGLLFFDLDRFKVVNDSLGHDAGDRLLVAMAERLVDVLRPGDMAARFGGDEFVVCLAGIESEEAAAVEAGRVVAALGRPLRLHDHELTPTVSMGVALGTTTVDGESLLTQADTAMYQAKARGKARFELYTAAPAPRGQGSVLELERDLRRAIDADQLRLLYQPLVDVETGGVVGAEALVRWQHPERGVIGPAGFIGVAEESGLIVPMGAWVVRTACAQLTAWRAELAPTRPLTMTVNVSARQLADPNFGAIVATALSDFGTDPTALMLEITESALLQDLGTAEAALLGLRDMGVRIAVDDFGTGYSSLSHLKLLPVDMLKIDRSFVADIGTDGADTAIVGAAVRLANALGLVSVAEGVEHRRQMDWLSMLGCQLAQGYFLAHPGEPEAVGRMLSRGLPHYSGSGARFSSV